MSRSDKNSIYLRNLSLESYGNYTCQVSTDRPFFRCVQTTRQLEVVVPPSDGPILMEEKSDYELGDNVSILCNSGKSKPAPELKWYINDQLEPSQILTLNRMYYIFEIPLSGVESPCYDSSRCSIVQSAPKFLTSTIPGGFNVDS
ncbi:uncharacterized protein TNCV_1703641 [Trichonephila clavipes]|nr:uncharacterized protein TNCV_1703641 [Trichonephila clavipes]